MGDEVQAKIQKAIALIKADRPSGREFSLAVTKLEEALMWYDKGYSLMAAGASENAGVNVIQNPTR